MADNKIKILIDSSEAAKSLKDIKTSIKELKSQALEVGEGGSGFKELTNQANKLQDKLDDLKDSAKSLQGTGIEKLKSSFALLTDSFKNADFGKAKTAFSGLGAAMKAVPIFLLVEGIMYLVENFEKLSQGSGFLAKVLKGIGDIISWCIDKIYEFTDALGLTNSTLDKQGEAIEKNGEKLKKSLDQQTAGFDRQIAAAKAAGKSTVELEVKKQEAIVETNRMIAQQVIDFQKAGGVLTEKQKEIFENAIENIKNAKSQENTIIQADRTQKLEKFKAANKKELDELNKYRDEYLKLEAAALKEEMDRMNAYVAEQRKLLEDLRESELDSDDNFYAEKHSKAIKAAQNDLIGDEDNLAKKRNLLEQQRQEEIRLARLKGEEIESINKKYVIADEKLTEDSLKNKIDKVNKYTQAVGAALNSIVGAFQAYQDLQRQNEEQDTKEREAVLGTQLQNLSDARDMELAKEGLTQEQKAEITQRYAQKEYELKLLEYNRNTEVKKKAFEQDKKLRIAQAIISTITGVVSAVTGMIQAVPGPVGIVLGAVAGAAVAAMGALQVASISKQKFDAGSAPQAPSIQPPSDSGSGGGGYGAGAQDGPKLYQTGQGDTQTGGNSQRHGQVMKAYVVSQEVTSSQNMDAVIERRSSF